MSYASGRRRDRQEAKKQLVEIRDNANQVLVIHYSCERFNDRDQTKSPRITSIAVRNLMTAQTKSFSIHEFAERDRKIVPEEIGDHYDRLEKCMLKEFFDYAKNRENYIWLHWNMRDSNYGFEALERRFKVHGGEPFSIHEAVRRDLARVLVRLYGPKYIGHRRLKKLAEKNHISMKDFLLGEEEAQAFDEKQYVALHLSTLRKVQIISDIAIGAADDKLKTDASKKEVYGGNFAFWMEKAKDHPRHVGILGAVASIAGFILYVLNLLWNLLW